MTEALFVYVTFASDSEAKRLARQAIEKGLAACVNILPAHQSLYRWHGKIETANEHIALFKTTKEHEDSLRDWLTKAHSFECPCIATIPITNLNPAFAAWLLSSQ